MFRLLGAVGFGVVFISAAAAVPYASHIRVTPTTVEADSGTSISYDLNEAATSVSIHIIDNVTSAVVASLDGEMAQGLNLVNWNGRTDNFDGTVVPQGQYVVSVTAAKTNVAWAEIASQRSRNAMGPANVVYNQAYKGFSPTDVFSVFDTSSDFFGTQYAQVSSNAATNPAHAFVELNSDLSVADGTDGYAGRIMREPTYDGKNTGSISTLWYGCSDPLDSNIVYTAGQSEPGFWYGDLADPANLKNADPSDFLGNKKPRAVLVVDEGEAKYAYFCNDTDIIKAPMTGNVLSGAPVTVSFFTARRSAIGLGTDAAGNLYFVSRYVNTLKADDGMLLRWNRSDTLGANPNLTESNCSWRVPAASGMLNMHGPAISPTDGNVYVLFSSGSSSNSKNGAYLVGNTADETVKRTLAAGDRVVNTTTVGTGWSTHSSYSTVRTDAAGNLIIIDCNQEQIRMYTPGGDTAIKIPAPASQLLTITPRAAVDEWALY